jgi:hypothetical protein
LKKIEIYFVKRKSISPFQRFPTLSTLTNNMEDAKHDQIMAMFAQAMQKSDYAAEEAKKMAQVAALEAKKVADVAAARANAAEARADENTKAIKGVSARADENTEAIKSSQAAQLTVNLEQAAATKKLADDVQNTQKVMMVVLAALAPGGGGGAIASGGDGSLKAIMPTQSSSAPTYCNHSSCEGNKKLVGAACVMSLCGTHCNSKDCDFHNKKKADKKALKAVKAAKGGK